MTNPTFAELLTMIEDRSAALRAAAGQAGLTARVPGCPDWSVRDLIAHLGEVQRFWAAAVAAGPADGPPDEDQVDRTPGDDLMGWSAAATQVLTGALAAAGPDRPCWTWWAESGAPPPTSPAPSTSGAVARHQVQEAGVHAFDAQEAAGRAEPLPAGVAADGIGEFLTVGMATEGPWPHRPGTVALAAVDGPAWLIELSADGARAVPGGPAGADAQVRATASDLVLALYGRRLAGDLALDGDQELARQLLHWSSSE